MRNSVNWFVSISVIALASLIIVGASTPSLADTGLVRAVVTKGGFIVGVGGGRGTLLLHGHSYPLSFSGMSLGATIGLSTARLSGHANNIQKPSDIEGTYGDIGGAAAVAAGRGGVRLQNAKGVVLGLAGPRAGVELSVAMGGVTVTLR